MRSLGRLALAVLLVFSFAAPSLAKMATIEATAPLQDHSEQSIETALVEAVKAAVYRAIAMGFSWAVISQALVLEDAVSVQLLASDTSLEREDEDAEGPGPGGVHGPTTGQPEQEAL